MEEIVYIIRDTEENLLFYLNADGGLKAEVKQGSANILPEPPIMYRWGTPSQEQELNPTHPLYTDALLQFLYDRGLYHDEIFIEVDDEEILER